MNPWTSGPKRVPGLKLAIALFLTGALHAQSNVQFCNGSSPCAGRNPKVRDVRIILQSGARARWSPNGQQLVFDRQNADGFYDVYVSDINGTILRTLTEGKSGIAQRNNGNAIYHPSGEYVIFVSETADHFADQSAAIGDPGIGLYSNLWATDTTGSRFWQLTDIPIKQSLVDGTPSYAVVNPNISPEGTQLVWTERYAGGGNHNWGTWRLKTSPIRIDSPGPRLTDERVLFQPSGNYVTSMGFFDVTQMLVTGNLNGQHEFGMDLYRLNTVTLQTQRLVDTPQFWEEGACISPNGRYVVYMSNQESRVALDFNNASWFTQPIERDYFLMAADGSSRERLTFFNDPSSPEYLGRRLITATCEFSPDGRYLSATLGVDFGTADRADLQLKVARIELSNPAMFSEGDLPRISSGGIVNAASLQAPVTAGSFATIFGQNLAPATRIWAAADFQGNRLPSALEGVSVTVGGRPASIYYISPTQLNIILPDNLPDGPMQVQVRNARGLSQTTTFNVQRVAPALFPFGGVGRRYAAAVTLSGEYVGPPNLLQGVPTRPARPGEIVLLYGTGLGPTTPPRPANEIFDGPAPTLSPVRVTVGGVAANVLWAGLVSPGFYQLNVQMPDVPDGDRAVTVEVEGQRMQNELYIPIRR